MGIGMHNRLIKLLAWTILVIQSNVSSSAANVKSEPCKRVHEVKLFEPRPDKSVLSIENGYCHWADFVTESLKIGPLPEGHYQTIFQKDDLESLLFDLKSLRKASDEELELQVKPRIEKYLRSDSKNRYLVARAALRLLPDKNVNLSDVMYELLVRLPEDGKTQMIGSEIAAMLGKQITWSINIIEKFEQDRDAAHLPVFRHFWVNVQSLHIPNWMRLEWTLPSQEVPPIDCPRGAADRGTFKWANPSLSISYQSERSEEFARAALNVPLRQVTDELSVSSDVLHGKDSSWYWNVYRLRMINGAAEAIISEVYHCFEKNDCYDDKTFPSETKLTTRITGHYRSETGRTYLIDDISGTIGYRDKDGIPTELISRLKHFKDRIALCQ